MIPASLDRAATPCPEPPELETADGEFDSRLWAEQRS